MALNPTYVPIQSFTVSGTSTTSLSFTNIPQGYTDLCLVLYGRTSYAQKVDTVGIEFNSATTGQQYSGTSLFIADALYPGVARNANTINWGQISGNTATTNIFGMAICNISNYSSPNMFKTFLSKSTADYANSPAGSMGFNVATWQNTSPITQIDIHSNNGVYYFFAGSVATLYGIQAAPAPIVSSPKASGGAVSTDGTYWYHAFLSSGSFIPSLSITCDVLVVGGGGSGGGNSSANFSAGGGGGAGQVIGYTSQTISTTQTVTIGSGGAAVAGAANNGASTTFGSLTAAVGGGAGGSWNAPAGGNGASGGGGAGRQATETNAGGTASAGGNAGAGGAGYSNSSSSAKLSGGGGGGAGELNIAGTGGAATSTAAGNGGFGANYITGWGQLGIALGTTGTGILGYIAGGGGGGAAYSTAGAGTQGFGGTYAGNGQSGAGNGGIGTSGAGQNGYPALSNTGSGGGGGADNYNASGVTNFYGGSGGSGLVIVRYAV